MSNDTPNPIPTPAGWYPDNGNPQVERYWDGTTWTSQTRVAQSQVATGYVDARANAKAAKAYAKATRPWYLKKRWWALGIVAFIFVIAALGSGGGSESPTATDPATTESNAAPASEAAKKDKPAEPKLTPSQENAIEAAENYIELMPFSKKGLIRQLSSEAGDGYPEKDARFAANHIKVDWNAEALEAAKNYQDLMPMSRDGLIQQLTSSAGDQFTREQAEYAVNKLGL